MTRQFQSRLALAGILACSCALTGHAAGQRGRGGAPAQVPSGPAPQRDLSGVWTTRNPPGLRRTFGNTFTDPRTNPPALTAWGEARLKEAKESNSGKYTLAETNDPVLTKCYPPGLPRIYFHPFPFEIVQTPKYTLALYEYDHVVRRIYTDGRPVPKDPDELWMGTSVGHWENDTTLVVETVGFNEKTWLDRIGHAHSNQLKVTERFKRVDLGHLTIDITMDDPKALAKPWVAETLYFELRPNWDLQEISCSGDYLEFPAFEK
jgi:hypothetical protein